MITIDKLTWYYLIDKLSQYNDMATFSKQNIMHVSKLYSIVPGIFTQKSSHLHTNYKTKSSTASVCTRFTVSHVSTVFKNIYIVINVKGTTCFDCG